MNEDRLVAAYRSSVHRRGQWRRLSEGVWDGLWLGLLSRRQLRLVDEAFYAVATEPVGDAHHTYADPVHIRSGLAPWEKEAVATFPPGATVVVTSAGGGREVRALEQMGFDVFGFEPNRSLVKAGHAVLGDPTRLQVCEPDRFPTFSGLADAVVIGWGSYMLIPGRSTRVGMLLGAQSVLAPGGRLLVSYFDRPRSRYFPVVRLVGSVIRWARRRPALELGDALAPNFAHHFTPEEVTRELDLAGFDVIDIHRTPYGHALAQRR